MDKCYLIAHWEAVRQGLVETIDKFEDVDLDYSPFSEGRSVREMILHIANEEQGEFRLGILQDIPDFPPAYPVEDYPTLAPIKALLEAVHAETMAFLGALGEDDLERLVVTPWGPSYRLIEMLGHIVEHEIHHRGELSLVLGMLGRPGLDA